MHATKSVWSGQAFAVVSSNDSGGRKSRVRRSKEERKAMTESFIKKKKSLDALHAYSVETPAEWMTLLKKSNNGSFPSLNLAHKEVGGSFYTVREIVREIIQENRVLAPPKVSIDENCHSELLDLLPLGSISVEPPFNLAESERVDTEAHLVPDRYQLVGDESIASSSIQFHETMPIYLANEQILEGVRLAAKNKEVSDEACASNHSTEEVSNTEQLLQPHFDVFKDKKVSNGVVMPEVSHHFNMQEVPSYKNDKLGDETIDVGQRNHEEVLLKVLNVEKLGAKDVEGLDAITSHMKSDVVVEKFPLRPTTKMDRLEDSSIGHDTIMHFESSIDLTNGQDEIAHHELEEFNGRHKDEKVVQKLQNLPGKRSEHCVALELSPPDVSDHEKASSSQESSNSQDPIVGGRRPSYQDNNNSNKRSNSTLDRMNLETWEGSANRTERNPFLALVKALVTVFSKLWSE